MLWYNKENSDKEIRGMKKKLFALALGSLMAVSVLTACGGDGGDKYVKSALGATICYDNLQSGYIAEEDTQYKLELKKNVDKIVLTAKDANGQTVEDASTVATFDEATGVLTAKGKGRVTLSLQDKKGKQLSAVNVSVAPAYPENPMNAYTPTSNKDYGQASPLAGWCHDPSLIETTDENGNPVYYIFSTGWGGGNEIRKSSDMIHWEYVGKTFSSEVHKQMIEGEVGAWLYNNGAVSYTPSWWAPDIVPAHGGGYWLYTCVVDGGPSALDGGKGVPVDGQAFTRACILLCYSPTLEKESFTYVDVLMQSSIPFRGADEDVNAIDPQIIYDEEGNMYMAYGSFGTGNYLLELDPETGLRKDDIKGWQTHEYIRDSVAEATDLYRNYKNEEAKGKPIGWEHEYYGKNISYNDMEAPVIARHDNVTIFDENGIKKDAEGNDLTGKTYYYSMHSYDGLSDCYSMWGGRSESVWGTYFSANNEYVANNGISRANTTGNKYMGEFSWADKSANTLDIVAPGHNDLFTMSNGTNIAAYITRTDTYKQQGGATGRVFVSQMHQYYLNSMGDLVINPNRYGGEVDRSVSKEELLAYTQDNMFKMIALYNSASGDARNNTSVYVKLHENGTMSNGETGAAIGTWKVFGLEGYGGGYVRFDFSDVSLVRSQERIFYGVIRPAWLDDQNRAGFTITCMGQTKGKAMFMNNVSTL